MELFEQIGKKASEAYKITADKTGKMAKETKMKLKMGELRTKINELYEEIGKRVYENHLLEDNEDCNKEVEEKCIKIDVLSDEIESLLQQCLQLRNKRQCKNCHKEIEKDAKFCPNCGEKQEEEKPEQKEQEKTNLETIVEVEADVTTESKNNEEQNENLEKTVEIESNVSDNLELTEEEVVNAGADVEENDEQQ